VGHRSRNAASRLEDGNDPRACRGCGCRRWCRRLRLGAPTRRGRPVGPASRGRAGFGRTRRSGAARRLAESSGIRVGLPTGALDPSPVPTAALRSSGAASSWGTSWLTRFAVRGHPADFDGWAKRGNPGWSFGDVLPAFRRLEADADFGDAPWHVDEARLGEGVSIETVGGPLGTTSVDAPGRQRRENSPSERTSTPRRSPPKPQRMTEPIWWGRQTGAQRWGVRFAKQTLCQLCAQIPVSAPLRRWPFPAIESALRQPLLALPIDLNVDGAASAATTDAPRRTRASGPA
jgi:hypothetical protein